MTAAVPKFQTHVSKKEFLPPRARKAAAIGSKQLRSLDSDEAKARSRYLDAKLKEGLTRDQIH